MDHPSFEHDSERRKPTVWVGGEAFGKDKAREGTERVEGEKLMIVMDKQDERVCLNWIEKIRADGSAQKLLQARAQGLGQDEREQKADYAVLNWPHGEPGVRRYQCGDGCN